NDGVFIFDELSDQKNIKVLKYTDDYGLSSNNITCIVQGNHNNMWIGTLGGGLNVLRDQPSLSFNTLRDDKNRIISDMLEDNKGNKWIGTDNGVICDNGITSVRYTVEDGLLSNYTHSLLEDKAGN